jgi:glutathione S-transferase
MAHELILHHYWRSPYSERVRKYLAMKGVNWRSVETPNMLPKQDLIILTGGYRKAPVLQIGANIFCDSQIILREIERRFPDPALVGNAAEYGICYWIDRAAYVPTISLLFGLFGDQFPAEFVEDRERMFPDRSFDFKKLKETVPQLRDQWRSYTGFIHEQLRDGRKFLTGDRPRALDAACCMNIRLIARTAPGIADPVLAEFPRIAPWLEHIEALGQSSFLPMEAGEALRVARNAEPDIARKSDPSDPNGLEAGMRVSVVATDYGRDEVLGELIFSDAREIAIQRVDPQLGALVVHFPRAGYNVSRM